MPDTSIDEQINLMAVPTPENACVSDNADEFDRRLAASLAEVAFMGLRATLVFALPAAFIDHRFATFWTVHGKLLVVIPRCNERICCILDAEQPIRAIADAATTGSEKYQRYACGTCDKVLLVGEGGVDLHFE
jgi:hypothetical protein